MTNKMSPTQGRYVVEYRNLLGEWHPDLRHFNRAEAIAIAQRIRRLTRQNQPTHVARQLRTRVRRDGLPAPSAPYLTPEERFARVQEAMRG